MSYGVGSAVVLLVTDQNLILQTAFHGWNVANPRPASGHAAAPPMSVMKSRLFMSSMGTPMRYQRPGPHRSVRLLPHTQPAAERGRSLGQTSIQGR
jgi:hypothetical protein